MRGSVVLGILLLLVGLMSVPFFKEAISRFLLIAMFGGALILLVVFVVGGVVLVALRGAD
jgi:hypothetical protein